MKRGKKDKESTDLLPGALAEEKTKKSDFPRSKEGGPPVRAAHSHSLQLSGTFLTPNEVWVYPAASEGNLTRPTSAFSPQ